MLALWAVAVVAAPPDGAAPGVETLSLASPAREWAVVCSAREAALILHPNSYLRYRMHIEDEKGERVREEIETPAGSVARLIEKDGRPLTAEEDSAERARLQAMVDSPSSFARHIKSEQTNKNMGVDLLKEMPDAMLWSYAPGQPQPPGASPGGGLVVLDFTPNPKWVAPTIASDALTGLAGRIWVDPKEHEIVRFEGKLVKPVNVGWGVVAHLYPGGTVELNQKHVAGDRWIADHVIEQLVVRALMVKTIHQKLVYDTADVQPVPSMSYQQAIKLLLDTPIATQTAEVK